MQTPKRSDFYKTRLGLLVKHLSRQMNQLGEFPGHNKIHSLRITIRRIQSVVTFVRSDVHKPSKKTLNNLKVLGKHLGRCRELDVAISDAKNLKLNDHALKRTRSKYGKRLARYLHQKRTKQTLKKLSKSVNGIKLDEHLLSSPPLSHLHKQLTNWRRTSIQSKSQIHIFRTMIKKTRYVLEAVGKPAAPLKKLQTHLGRAHDMEVLAKLVGSNTKISQIEQNHIRQAKKLISRSIRFALKQTL